MKSEYYKFTAHKKRYKLGKYPYGPVIYVLFNIYYIRCYEQKKNAE